MSGSGSGSGDGNQDDGVVTSAPASKYGNLLTDLLSDAKKDIAAERQKFEQQLKSRADEEREEKARDEARKREAMQQKLIEETRRRNEALAKRSRSTKNRMPASTAPHMRPQQNKSAVAAVPGTKSKGLSLGLVAALVIVGIGVGLGTAMILTPTPKVVWPNIDFAAQKLVEQAATAATAEKSATDRLTAATDQIAQLTGDLQKSQQQKVALQESLAETEKQVDALKAALDKKGNGHTPRRGGGKTGPSVPSIDTGVFGGGK